VCYSFFAVYRCKLHDRKGSGRTDAETNEISPVKEQELRSDSESNIKLAAKNETVVMSGVMAISMLLCCIPLHVLRIIGEYTTNDAVGGVSELYHLGIFVFVQKQVNCRLKQDLNSKNIHK